MDASTAVSLACEVISLITVPAGLVMLVAWLVSARRSKTWVATEAVVMRHDDGAYACWFDDAGGMHEARLDDRHRDALSGDTTRVWTHDSDASRHRLAEPGTHAPVLRLLTFALLIPGVVASVVGSVVTFAS